VSDEGDDVDRDAELGRIEARLRELEPEDLDLVPPPPEIWAAIDQTVTSGASTATVVELAPRRSRAWSWAAVAAAAVVVVVAGVLIATPDGADETVVSSAQLAHDPATFDPLGADASATALLVRRGDQYEIRLTDAELPQLDDDDLELWLIEPDADGAPLDVAPVAMVEGSGPGSYLVPSGLDPASHFVVDISIEPRDGDAAHSGRSILRGALEPE
jgi:anti-sigma-K factor RskA